MMATSFTVEPYTYQVQQRSYADCQENQGSRSDWWYEDRHGFQIRLGEKVVKRGFGDKMAADLYVQRHLKAQGIRAYYTQLRRDLRDKLRAAKVEEERELRELRAIKD